MTVQLLSFPGCPNAAGARDALRRSLAVAGLDIANDPPTGPSCRIYRTSAGGRSVPRDELIVRALSDARKHVAEP